MRKFNKNIIVFVFCMLFVGVGLCSGELFEGIGEATQKFFQGKSSGFKRLAKLENSVDSLSTEKLFYHNQMMDVNSLKENLLGTRVVQKDDIVVVKSDSGSLVSGSLNIPSETNTKEDIQQISNRIKELRIVTESNGAHFLYCYAPAKLEIEDTPPNVYNTYYDNKNTFFSAMDSLKIPYIDLANSFDGNGGLTSNDFYKTDHHWTANAGFCANKYICEQLSARYGFEVNREYTDIDNYNIKTFDKWFLGSFGKKVGTYFTWFGADDFDLITPKFETDLTEEQPFKDQTRTGKFEETVLYMDNLEKDYYGKNTYATYSGGDFRLQIMKNNLNKNGKKILLIRDSFACVVAPFLSLQTSELHICDMRDFEDFVGDKINAEDYIKNNRPDYVIVLYSGIGSLDKSNGTYDFF